MVLLKSQPTLIAKSIGSVVLTSWEPQPTVQYYCAISQLTFLCASVEVDGSFRSAMKAIVVAAGSDGGSEKERVKAEGLVRGLMSTFVQAMIPPGASCCHAYLCDKACLILHDISLYSTWSRT